MVPVAQRLKFSKTGRLKFISHLDLCRTMKSAFLRAGVPIFYSEGFNPHPKMVFSMPLPLGVECDCEFLDIKITEPMTSEEIRDRMRKALTEELYVQEVYTPEHSFKEIEWAEYDFFFDDTPDLSKLIQESIVIDKQTKSGSKTVDIKPEIRAFHADGSRVTAVLKAGNENYLNPAFVAALIGGEYSIRCTHVYREDGTEFR